MKNFNEHPLFQKLISLDLPNKDFAIFGSGPLFLHNIRDEIHDLDLLARGEAWEKVTTLGDVMPTFLPNRMKVVLFDGDIEIFNNWAPGEWDINKLIDEAEDFNKLKFVQLDEVLKWKKLRREPKDLLDIQKIEKYLAEKR